MHKNPIWLCFLSIIILATCIYTGTIGFKLYRYWSLSSQTEALATAWSIQTDSDEEFVPLAKYTFQAGDKFFVGQTLFSDQKTSNPWAAQEALKPLAAKKHHVWYASKDPSDSSLQRKFPFKECIYAGVLWAVCIYFFWLGVYVAKVQK